MEYVSIASLRKPFGLKGQIHAVSLTSFPELRFKKNHTYTLTNAKGEQVREVTLNYYNIQGEALVLGFKEITTPEEAKEIMGYSLDMPKDEAPMPKGYIRYSEILGYKGIDDEGKEIGTLIDVVEYSPTPNFKFMGLNKKTFYVPFIDVFVGEINHESKTIQVHVMEGLL